MRVQTVSKTDRIIAALLKSNSRKEAAELAGVSERTVYNYLQRPDVLEAYEKARQNLVQSATEHIQRSLEPAVQLLTATVRNPAASTRARIAAARALLDYGIRYSEITDVYKRLEAVEQAREEDAAEV